MTATLFVGAKPQFFDNSGNPLSSGTLTTYLAGTSTLRATYTDNTLGTPNSTTITLNSRGESATDIWLDGAYKFVLKDSSGSTIWTVDNVIGTGVTLPSTVSKTSNYTVTTLDNNKLLLVDASSGAVTISLLSAATAGSGFTLTIKKTDSSANAVIVDGNASETIDSALTFALKGQNDGIQIMSNGANWFISVRSSIIYDVNGNELLKFGTTAAAVNEATITNAATGNAPSISATGDDTNIGIIVKGKGTGPVRLGQATSTGVQLEVDQPILDSSGNELIKVVKTASAVNEITVANAASAANPIISATGNDANIGIDFQAKGIGTYNLKGTVDQSAKLRMYEDTDNGTNYIEIVPPASITANRTITLPDSDYTLPLAATQAEQEAASITTAYTTPGRQQYHPSAAKAWVIFNGTGTVAITASYNVTSITDNGVGDYTVNFTTAFSAATAYTWAAGGLQSAANAPISISQDSNNAPTASACRFRVNQNGTVADIDRITIVFYGDQ
jgi:hypothetical protein